VKIVSVIFGTRFDRYMQALEASVRANAPNWDFEIIEGDKPARVNGLPQFAPDNHYKLRLWRDAVADARANSLLVLMDVDTIVLRDPSPAFAYDFDFAYTVRPSTRKTKWLNGGVVYCRVNSRTLAFFDRWLELDRELLEEPRRFLKCQHRHHVGQNQASLALAVKEPTECRLKQLPCRWYNNVDETWHEMDDDTIILHLKGALRELIDSFARQIPEHLQRARQAFAAYDPEEIKCR